ncbi:lish motif-containing protein [Flagelloscypha sp. PMI_526]|nr:lish motif-containing protein [Flagelloscypha sp. PMI_526]
MSTKPGLNALSNPNPYQLRSLVLDYLCQQSYPQTARIFARDSTTRNFDADGDEIMAPSLPSASGSTDGAFELTDEIELQVQRRKEIKLLIERGEVDAAITLLEKYFPFVLSETEPPPTSSRTRSSNAYLPATSVEPCHLMLNLRILAFTEALRTRPLVSGTTSSSAMDTSEDSSSTDFERLPQSALLEKAMKLKALSMLLPSSQDRAAYERELENVIGLLAYPVPEESEVARYLSQERRNAVADSVDAAIYYRLGFSPISKIELYTRYTSTCWTLARLLQAEPSANAILPPNWPPPSKDKKSSKKVRPPLICHCSS